MVGKYSQEGLNVEHFPNGIYLIQVLFENKTHAIGKFIVE